MYKNLKKIKLNTLPNSEDEREVLHLSNGMCWKKSITTSLIISMSYSTLSK